MTKFEAIGVGFQMESCSVDDANSAFRNSCEICASRGLRIDCDKCAISAAHSLTIGAFAILHGEDGVHNEE